jgi:probable phosphoglycerate mutase
VKLVLIRHGETVWNQQKRIQGWLDSPLTKAAKQQLENLSLPTCSKPIIFTSDLSRAYLSAQIIAKRLGVDVEQNELLRERCFGELQGEVIDMQPTLGPKWKAYHARYNFLIKNIEEIETEASLESRVRCFMAKLSKISSNQDVIIVGHGEWLRAFSNILHGQPSWCKGKGIFTNGLPQEIEYLLTNDILSSHLAINIAANKVKRRELV